MCVCACVNVRRERGDGCRAMLCIVTALWKEGEEREERERRERERERERKGEGEGGREEGLSGINGESK